MLSQQWPKLVTDLGFFILYPTCLHIMNFRLRSATWIFYMDDVLSQNFLPESHQHKPSPTAACSHVLGKKRAACSLVLQKMLRCLPFCRHVMGDSTSHFSSLSTSAVLKQHTWCLQISRISRHMSSLSSLALPAPKHI